MNILHIYRHLNDVCYFYICYLSIFWCHNITLCCIYIYIMIWYITYVYIKLYTLTLRTRKIRRVALKTQGFKTKPKVFLFPQIYTNFKTMPPNALILLMRWVLKKCCISVQSTGHRRPNTSPNTTKTYYIFTSSKGFQPMFISWVHTGKSRVEHGLNTG